MAQTRSFRHVTDPDGLHAVAQLRYAVFVSEKGYAPPAADHDQQTLADPLDAHSAVFAAFEGSRAVATVRYTEMRNVPADHAWRTFYAFDRFHPWEDQQFSVTSRLVVMPELRGSLVAAQLFRMVYEYGDRAGTAFNFCNCVPSLVHMFELIGYRRYASGQIDPDGVFRLPMVFVAGDLAHLEKLRSPLLPLARNSQKDPDYARWFREALPNCSEPSSVRLLGADEFYRRLSSAIHGHECPLFEGMDDVAIKSVFASAIVLPVADGDAVMRRGDSSTDLFVVLNGAVEVRHASGSQNVVGIFGKGDFFGEGAFLSSRPRSAECRALGNTQLLALTAESFAKLALTDAKVALMFMKNMAASLCGRIYGGDAAAA